MRQLIQYEHADEVQDFSLFVTKPCVPPDIELKNASNSWGFHKAVLRKISPVFADILDGDENLKSISLSEDVTDDAMDIVQKFTYSIPEQRRNLFRNSKTGWKDLEVIGYQVIGAGTQDANGLYTTDQELNGCTMFRKNGKPGHSHIIYRSKKRQWYISKRSPGVAIDHKRDDLYIRWRARYSTPPSYGWASLNSGAKPAPTVHPYYKQETEFPFDTATYVGIHTILSKYELKIPDLTAYLEWLYARVWSPLSEDFSARIGDARNKNLDTLVEIACRIQIENFEVSSITQYPSWFQQMVLRSQTRRSDLDNIFGLITQKAMQDMNTEMISIISDALSKRSEKFKAAVLDVQLHVAKRRKIE